MYFFQRKEVDFYGSFTHYTRPHSNTQINV